MKKMILMAAFAAFAFAANAQTEPTASTSAAVTPEVKSVSKSKAKKACCAGGEAKAACGEAKAEKAVN